MVVYNDNMPVVNMSVTNPLLPKLNQSVQHEYCIYQLKHTTFLCLSQCPTQPEMHSLQQICCRFVALINYKPDIRMCLNGLLRFDDNESVPVVNRIDAS